MSPLKRVSGETLSREIAYVLAARGLLARLYRSVRAAWRCAREARSRA